MAKEIENYFEINKCSEMPAVQRLEAVIDFQLQICDKLYSSPTSTNADFKTLNCVVVGIKKTNPLALQRVVKFYL
ncbi:MAG: hypothetical protein WD135_08660 [Ferruginibacter sp.]